MKRLILIGDGLFQGKAGYKELLESHLILASPQFPWEISSFTEQDMTYKILFDQLPLHVIGKAPELVLLALGYSDILCGISSEDTERSFKDTLELIIDKTRANIMIVNLCSVFFKGNDKLFQRCTAFNRSCAEMSGTDRIFRIDLDSVTEKFISDHRAGKGEKRSLHLEGPRLTTLGALLISRIVADSILSGFNRTVLK